jgi:hypothetical protein
MDRSSFESAEPLLDQIAEKIDQILKSPEFSKTHNDRLEEDDSKGHLIVRSIGEWEAAGFPGTWDEWWNRWWDKHVAEHKEWLVWLHSDSHMSFWDWKERQKTGAVPITKTPK